MGTDNIGVDNSAAIGEKAPEPRRDVDDAWRARASKVIPGGMYGHIQAEKFPKGYPQFFDKSDGCRVWDVDGYEYIDMMCSWGPMILGYRHPKVEEAYHKELAQRDLAYGPSPLAVELAERYVELLDGADWAVFAKNGGDATALATVVARAATGRKKILKAGSAYHGSTPWYTPVLSGITPEDRANIIFFDYNDIPSLEAAVAEAGDDLAGIIVTPHRHELYLDQVPVDPAFAQRIRSLCDEKSAVMILDDVRAGFRVSIHGSWSPLGIVPDLSTYSKCIANGHALSALVGVESLKEAASSIYATGSFWYASAPMAAGLATLDVMEEMDAVSVMNERGNQFMEGMRKQGAAYGIPVSVTGPPAMPFLRFEDGGQNEQAFIWSGELLRRGVFVHPWHNWFVSTAHTEADIDRALEATDGAFAYLASQL
ncbi:aminotransferase class III-fold pyridoxal phosphate-dependent enzyme [Aeromicrobium sp. 9AM]|uniref:aminotransferase class III-fold pyridoxal phosphate-dependent enzyme n=1 Tax=Aeromicrobium sp. 9AM TaxID=2653126 RepID=UPI00135A7E58|nr:aminotransferase class III-fold pyridoxal phosphate-dependent enzyme [Aeromicrobium sp. 9AM]